MANILLLDGDTRQVLPVAAALRARGHRVSVACESRLSVGWFSRYPHERILLPSAAAEPDRFAAELLSLLRENDYDVTLPLFDVCAHVVVDHLEEVERHTRTAMPRREVFMRARDKANTMRICQEHGIPCPRTCFPDEQPFETVREELLYPALAKPRIAHGAAGIVRIAGPDQLQSALDRVKDDYEGVIVQEFIPQTGSQFKAQLFRDRDGTFRAAVVFDKLRYFPLGGGTSSINQTVDRPEILQTCRRLLDAMEWTGYADVDLIEDPRDGVVKVMEVNPRTTGSIKIAFEAGIDFADLLVRFAERAPLETYEGYKVGVTMRYIPLDILWFLYSPDRFSAQPSWFRFWGRDLCYQVFSLKDPGPFLALGLSGLAKLTSPKVRAAKFGGQRP